MFKILKSPNKSFETIKNPQVMTRTNMSTSEHAQNPEAFSRATASWEQTGSPYKFNLVFLMKLTQWSCGNHLFPRFSPYFPFFLPPQTHLCFYYSSCTQRKLKMKNRREPLHLQHWWVCLAYFSHLQTRPFRAFVQNASQPSSFDRSACACFNAPQPQGGSLGSQMEKETNKNTLSCFAVSVAPGGLHWSVVSMLHPGGSTDARTAWSTPTPHPLDLAEPINYFLHIH